MKARLLEQEVSAAFPHMLSKAFYQKAPDCSMVSQEGIQNYFCNFLASLVDPETSGIELGMRGIHHPEPSWPQKPSQCCISGRAMDLAYTSQQPQGPAGRVLALRSRQLTSKRFRDTQSVLKTVCEHLDWKKDPPVGYCSPLISNTEKE